MDTTYDAARRCPKCQEPGMETGRKSFHDGSKQLTITCGNERCPWFNTNYAISVRPDGSVPEPNMIRDKHYPSLPVDRTEQVQQAIDNQINAERGTGAEVSRGRR